VEVSGPRVGRQTSKIGKNEHKEREEQILEREKPARVRNMAFLAANGTGGKRRER